MTSLSPSWLAKDCLDVGLFTNNLEDMLSFWQEEVGISFDHVLPLGGGVRQHRHDFEGAVLKINHSKSSLPPKGRGGLQRLIVARKSETSPREMTDPDGNVVELVPPGSRGIHHWAIEIIAHDEKQFLNFYHRALGLPIETEMQCAVRCGRSQIVARIDPEISGQTESEPLARLGYQYTTVQVRKVDTVHANVLAKGGTEGRPPETLGETARISFVRDGNGNWMELSQRASLTGSLEPG